MWILANGPVSLSDGVCAFLGNGPSLFWLGFMLWLGKNSTRVCSTLGYLFVCRDKEEKTHCILKASVVVRFHCESHTPWVL